jgi:hypothetical protein
VPGGTRRTTTSGRARRRLLAVLALAACGATLGSASADAASFTWSGAATPGTSNWSAGANWGGTAPAGAVEELTFPALTSAACTPPSPPLADPCSQSNNDLSGLSVNAISIDDGVEYNITGSAITLGAGGITAAPSANDTGFPNPRYPRLGVPITLGAPQTWAITGGSANQQLDLGAAVTGGFPLTVDLSSQTFLGVNTQDVEVGPIAVSGTGGSPSPGALSLGPGAGSVNATDGNPLSFSAGAGLAAFGGSTGPLTMTGGQLQVGEPGSAGQLTVNGGVTLNATELSSFVQPGANAGVDYSQLDATGTVSLVNARLRLSGGSSEACPKLNPGEVDTLIATPAELTGTFVGVQEGAVVQIACNIPTTVAGQTLPAAKINYTAHAVTATIQPEGTLPSALPPPTQLPPPVLGRSETVSVISGRVTLRRRGTSRFVPLAAAASIPDGSELDATHGRVGVTAATLAPGQTASAEVYEGRFVVHQDHTALTHLTLSLPLGGCRRSTPRDAHPRAPATAASGHSQPRSRRLWASDSGGSWGTNGRYVTTTVEGTRWLTVDTCRQSQVQVAVGAVRVRDLIHRRTRVVTAGHRYVAALGSSTRRR